MIIDSPQIHTLNAALFTEYKYQNFALGFNIDLIGYSFGPSKSSNEFSNGFNGEPESFNFLRGAESDIGTLNSEFWIGYYVSNNLMVKFGLSHFVSEYRTQQADATNNSRYRKFNDFIIIGFNYVF